MPRAAGLQYDHEVLRGKLAILEDFLPALIAVPCTISRLTDSLATCWHAHTEREERLLDALMRQQDTPPLSLIQQLHDEHENQRTRLAILHALLTDCTGASEEQVMAQAGELIRDLREHMAEEEAALFPLLEEYIEPSEKAWEPMSDTGVEVRS